MIKCEIILNGYVYDATNDLVNWDDVEMKWKRNDFDGVVRSFTTKFEFAGSTYSLLVSEFIKNMLNASASIVFYTRNNSWLWNERFRCALDFSTFSYNGNTCEINAIDDTLAAKIKANRSTKYEYNVSELSEKDLDYDRLDLIGNAEWMTVMPEQGYYSLTSAANYATIGLYTIKSDVPKNSLYIQDCPVLEYAAYFEDIIKDGYLIENISSREIKVNLKLGLRFLLDYKPNDYGSNVEFCIQVGKYIYEENTHIFKMSFNECAKIKSGDILSIDKEISIPRDSILCIFLRVYNIDGTIIIEQISPLSIEYLFRHDSIKLPVISPVSLLNRLLKSINFDNEGITGEIVNPTYALQRTFILPAESIRGISQAKIYTSYKDFQEWMFAVFGFVPVIGDNKVSFVHMDTLFVDKQAKDIGNTSEFELSLDSSMVHSSVKVGYNKKDYDSVNGRDEFRFTTEYTTGTKLTDSSLELISPYRADAYGIEFLAQKRGEDTTDSSSDKDIFFVMVQSTDESVLHLERGQTITGVISPETMFNNLYAAPYMITAHYNYLRALGQKLFFASSDGNSDVKINYFALNADLELPNTALFLPARATFITDDSSIPDDLSGYISFVHQGKKYKGYVSEITLNIGRLESVKYELIVKSIEDA